MSKGKSKKIVSTCSRCRRVGEKLMLKGEKCLAAKCPLLKRSYAPGQHGPTQKGRKLSGYGKQLQEKQKVKGIYGILERQFANYVKEASKKLGDSSKYLLSYLEARLDNVIFRLGIAKSRISARQIVTHGFVSVNGKKVDIPSYRVKVGDIVALSDRAKTKKGFANLTEQSAKIDAPAWLGVEAKGCTAKILNTPTVENPNFNAKSIIEFYSR